MKSRPRKVSTSSSSEEDKIIFQGRSHGTLPRQPTSGGEGSGKVTKAFCTGLREKSPLYRIHGGSLAVGRGSDNNLDREPATRPQKSGRNADIPSRVPFMGEETSNSSQVDMHNVFAELEEHLRVSTPPEIACVQLNHGQEPHDQADSDSWRTIGQDWEQASKAIVPLRKGQRRRGKRGKPAYSLATKEEEDEAIADYIRNTIDAEDSHLATPIMQRNLAATQDDILNNNNMANSDPKPMLLSKSEEIVVTGKASSRFDCEAPRTEIMDAPTPFGQDAQITSCTESSSHTDDDSSEDVDSILRLLREENDWAVAARIAQVGDTGFENGSPDESDAEMIDLTSATLFSAAARYREKRPQRSKNGRRSQTFPSASALADAVEQDPYNGFDIMDFDRPSLRKKRKGKNARFDDSDSEVNRTFESLWQQDREKKKQRKNERAELRAQGLLGSKRKTRDKATSSVSTPPKSSDLRTQFEAFLGSDGKSLELPPMDKVQRKSIHYLANRFGLKSSSSGSGEGRHVTLMRTSRTTAFDGHVFARTQTRMEWAFSKTANQSRKSKGGRKTFSARSGGGGGSGGNAAFSYRHGEIVGAAAPEIGLQNRGRGMLERMGWSAGMALGAVDNKGILEPIAQVVRNSRAGLG